MSIEKIYSKIDKVNEANKRIKRFGKALSDAADGKARNDTLFAEMGLLGVQMLLITNVQKLDEILSLMKGCSKHKELLQTVNSMREKIQDEYLNISSLIKDLGI